jgi:hypothetical protein
MLKPYPLQTCLASLLLFFALSTHSQDNFHIGITGGKCFSWSRLGDNGSITDIELRPSFNSFIGVAIQFKLNSTAFISSGFNFLKKGIKAHHPDHTLSDAEKKYTTIEIPIAFCLRAHLNKGMYVKQRAGLSLDVIELRRDHDDPRPAQQPELYIIENSQRAVGASLFAGVDLEWETRRGYLIDLGFSYHQGISGYFKKGEVVLIDGDNEVRNDVLIDGSYLAFSLGCYIPGKKIKNIWEWVF